VEDLFDTGGGAAERHDIPGPSWSEDANRVDSLSSSSSVPPYFFVLNVILGLKYNCTMLFFVACWILTGSVALRPFPTTIF
jgi:hypothetical protein